MLTIQAVISSGVVIVVMVSLSIAQLVFRLHSVDIEGLEYDVRLAHSSFFNFLEFEVAVVAALINPVLMLYFVRDYRT